MKEQKKKKLIVTLLLVSCFISGYMLFLSSEGGSKQLRNLAQADTLIQKELDAFNIHERQIRVASVKVDSNFTRKIYGVRIPYGFSKTQLHAELNNTFYDYGVETPAQVIFPQQDVQIELYYRGTVVRTVLLQTDPDLKFDQNRVSILLAFEDIPDDDLLSKLASLGEPIPIVLKVENPMRANELVKQLAPHYRHILFWLQNDDGEDLIKANPDKAISKLKQMEDILPQAQIIQFSNGNQPSKKKLVTKTNMAFVDAGNALMLHEELGKASFMEGLAKLQNSQSYSMALITGNETTLEWLIEKLPELKKAGITITLPPKTQY